MHNCIVLRHTCSDGFRTALLAAADELGGYHTMVNRSIRISCCALLITLGACASLPVSPPVEDGLLLDLDADREVFLQEGDRVVGWRNQVADSPAQFFVHRDLGREVPGSGRPRIRRNVDAIAGHDAVVFEEQELVNLHEDEFDDLTTGSGYTWFCVMTVHEQRVGLVDVNSFFGNLRNGGNYEGFWGNVEDDNSVWIGSRNGITFGRFDENNPKLLGPRLEIGRYVVVAGRMAAGTDTVDIELFVDSPRPVGSVRFPVNPDADPSRMAIGQERDAVEHPGAESFHGEIARFLIYDHPLTDEELRHTMSFLSGYYELESR